jgi:hypothetical protein
MPVSTPPKWSEEQLKEGRKLAEARFILDRRNEGPSAFHAVWDRVEPEVQSVFAETQDLRGITGGAFKSNPALWQRLRYFCAPPISEEDLWTLVGSKFRNVPSALADATAAAINSVLDSRRFPWVQEGREPSDTERERAIFATAALLSHETLKTERRGVASRSQEEEVTEALVGAGLVLDASRKPILRLDELARGSFSRERKVAGAKCDVPIRLLDGRLLAIECKVSNGPKNSWKRLQREVGGKAEGWRQAFGAQVLTGAVLAGVFDLRCLVNAQNEQNVHLFWQHDLGPLLSFVSAAT